jgi:uncharacterized protein
VPRSRLAAPTGIEVTATAIVGGSNVLLNRVVPRRLQVPAALAAAGSLILLARRAGVTGAQLGLAKEDVGQGVSRGLAAGIPIGAVVALGAFVPWTARFFRDERIVRADMLEVAHEVLVRLPLATVVAEELMFRGALEAVFSQRRSAAGAALISAGLFGAWHALPTLDRIHSNPGIGGVHGGSKAKQAVIVVSICASTSATGLALSWLRRRSASIIAPILVHFAANAGGYFGGWLAGRRAEG